MFWGGGESGSEGCWPHMEVRTCTHTTPTDAHLYGAGQEGHQVLRLVDKDVDEVLRSRSLGGLARGRVLPPVAEAEGGDDLRSVLWLLRHQPLAIFDQVGLGLEEEQGRGERGDGQERGGAREGQEEAEVM